MKTFQDFLQEKWVADLKKSSNIYPIYENPGSSDFIALKKAGLPGDVVRFMAIQKTKKLYIWAGMMFIHSEALKKLVEAKIVPSSMSTQNLDDMLCGECHLKSGRLTFSENDGLDTYFGDVVDVIKNKEKFVKGEEYFVPLPYDTPFDLIKDVDHILQKYQFMSYFIDDYDTHSSPAILKNSYQLYKKK